VTITFALAVVPIVGFVGAAVDYSHANQVKASMQAAADSTALMLSKDAVSLSAAQLQTKADNYFKALFTRPDASDVLVYANYTSNGGSLVKVDASAEVKTHFMGVMGFKTLKIGVDSQVKWGNVRLRVALVLDTTGSMDDDGKIGALRTATKNLLAQLQGAVVNSEDVYVSIIPFVKDVNLGSGNSSATWIDWTEWEDEPPYIKTNKPSDWENIGPGDSCPFTNSSHGFRCQVNPTNASSTTSTIPSSGSYAGYICPSIDNGNKVSSKASVYYNGCYNSEQKSRTVSTGSNASCGNKPDCSCSGSGSKKKCTQTYFDHTWIKNARSTWNGCVVDRGLSNGPHANDYDTNVTTPSTAVTATLYAAEQHKLCPQPSMGLNNNWSSMTSLVNSLSANGNTNQGLGLQIGWMSLVGGGPFTSPPMDLNYKYSQVVILMSDGLNTQNRWYSSQGSIDAREALTCANAKSAGIIIYAVQVNTGGDPTQNVLKNCASTTDKFFLLTSANQLITTFQQIGTALTNLRITQ
jgi:Flp pilus assembly protein TadG